MSEIFPWLVTKLMMKWVVCDLSVICAHEPSDSFTLHFVAQVSLGRGVMFLPLSTICAPNVWEERRDKDFAVMNVPICHYVLLLSSFFQFYPYLSFLVPRFAEGTYKFMDVS